MRKLRSYKSHYGAYADEFLNKYYGKYCGTFNQINIPGNYRLRRNEFNLVAPNIPDYASELIGESLNIEYHLAGFSLLQRNAFVRAAGEAIERYSHLMAGVKLKDMTLYTTANELKKSGERVCPLKYVNVYTEEQLTSLNIFNFTDRHLCDDDKIEWLCCKSIYDDSPVYIPAQMFFLISSNFDEKRFYMSVSTGTASHKRMEQAMINALVEYLQVDSMMMSWYVLGKLNKIETPNDVMDTLMRHFTEIQKYDVIFCNMSLDKPLNVIGCIIKNKLREYPYCAFGMQADAFLEKAMYRSFMEAYANIDCRLDIKEEKTNFNQSCINVKKNSVYNLNDNTEFYLCTEGANQADEWLGNLITDSKTVTEKEFENKEDLLNKIKRYLTSISKYACYLEITSNEFEDSGWHVIRTVIPELLPLCMPSLPYVNHPRTIDSGGIRNRCIHPCP